MNIDEKLKNNWYLEQDEINTLIKRYRMMKYFNYVLLLIISVLLLTGCGIFGDDGSDVDYKIESKLITFSETVPQASIFAQFEELSSGHIFLAKLTPKQKEQLYVGWEGTLLLNEGDGYLVVMELRP